MTDQRGLVPLTDRGLAPQDLDGLWRVATMVLSSGLAPRSMNSQEAICLALAQGAELGLSPMQSLQSLAVINGKVTAYGDGLLAIVLGSDLCEGIEESLEGEGDQRVARCIAHRRGWTTPIERTFSVDDAKLAKLWRKKGPWTDYPNRMLQMRARGFCLRDGFADLLRGIITYEEVQDYSIPIRDIPVEVRDKPPAAEYVIEQQPAEQAEPSCLDRTISVRGEKRSFRWLAENDRQYLGWMKHGRDKETGQYANDERHRSAAAEVLAWFKLLHADADQGPMSEEAETVPDSSIEGDMGPSSGGREAMLLGLVEAASNASLAGTELEIWVRAKMQSHSDGETSSLSGRPLFDSLDVADLKHLTALVQLEAAQVAAQAVEA